MLKDPFMISSIIIALSFSFILICNYKLKSRVIKISFLGLTFLFLILIMIFDNNYIYSLLKLVISYLWYPNYLMFTTTILFSVILLIYSLVKNKLSFKNKIINYLLFSISFSTYIIFNRLNIDTNIYSSLYSTNSLIVLRIVTISFAIWLVLTIIFKLLDRRYYEK